MTGLPPAASMSQTLAGIGWMPPSMSCQNQVGFTALLSVIVTVDAFGALRRW